MVTQLVTAEEWFSSGRRVYFDPKLKAIVAEKQKDRTVSVFERVVIPDHSNKDGKWLTMLPGFPHGSYGFSRVESLLQANKNLNADVPRLYVEYVGQGNSDKPKEGYVYNTIERANLVEAQWKAHGVKTTVVVTMDFSSLVMMELMDRQKAREAKGIRYPRMEHVLSVNGGFFADGHTHTGIGNGTPLVRDRFGRVSASAAQRSNMVMNKMLLPLYSPEYRRAKVCRQEIKECQKAIRLHQGTRALANMNHFVDEHKKRADRWDLLSLYQSYCEDQDISFHLIFSEKEEFENEQFGLVKRRMKPFSDKVRAEKIAGGHMAMFEQAGTLVNRILNVVHKAKEVKEKSQRSWADTESPTGSTSSMSWTSPRAAQVDYGLSSSVGYGLAY
eukprot:CAMPEP_0172444486 /NCGR_PEP_ID=MMETSP1065-20121228/4511_1 /TAXON_ID=265537 /ORGANISM="Amphiprora paludosa, Strain CCMP125" /LENGTH=386 /DNA_ID=CAMNT_0013195029 /DNA_START=54 /DNA_END=1214 /DNA_ORIENTATION=+